jgi:Protein of unknown function (DUF1295)
MSFCWVSSQFSNHGTPRLQALVDAIRAEGHRAQYLCTAVEPHWGGMGRPLPDVVWSVTNSAAAGVLTALFWLGWAVVLISTFLINHFDLFGLQQVWAHAQGRQAEHPSFRTPLFYKFVRHPTYLGFLLAFWAAPVMTVGHLLFAVRPPATSLSGFCWRNETSSPSMGRHMSNTVRASP